MAGQWAATTIDGVLRAGLTLRSDVRGGFGELWRASWTDPLGIRFVQGNLSQSRSGVLRGLHYHLRQHDLWVILAGSAQVVLVDLRRHLAGDATEPPAVLSETLQAMDAVLIPPGVAHGFWSLEEFELLYLVSNEYDGSDEHGFAWDDQLAAIHWPGGDPVLSERDTSAPSLLDSVRRAANG